MRRRTGRPTSEAAADRVRFPSMAQKQNARIELTGPAKKQMATVSDNHGMTQVALMSRLVEWFVSQENTTQYAVMSRFPEEIQPDVARLIIQRIADGRK